MYSKVLKSFHVWSLIKIFNDSGIGGQFWIVFPSIKWLTSFWFKSSDLVNILKVSIDENINLCYSNKPFLTLLKTSYVIELVSLFTLLFNFSESIFSVCS